MTVIYLWLIAGVILSLAELHFSGVGLLFAGLGAIATGSFVHFALIGEQDYLAQLLAFFASTALFAVLLWKPFQQCRRPAPGYSNMIGETATAGNQGITRESGEAGWSGTVMQARLADHAGVARIEGGAHVVIVDVKGATLLVRPKE